MKYVLSLFLVCALLLSCAFAEEEFFAVCPGDTGKVVSLFAESIGYSAGNIAEEAVFDDDILSHLLKFQEENGLKASGNFDLETLNYIFGVQSETGGTVIVWIPMHGGKKYHNNRECSNMIDPRQAPVECALALELEPCKKCYK